MSPVSIVVRLQTDVKHRDVCLSLSRRCLFETSSVVEPLMSAAASAKFVRARILSEVGLVVKAESENACLARL